MTIYLAQLERFGYVLTAIGETEEHVRSVIMKEYRRAYRDINGMLITADAKCAAEEISVTKMDSDHVEWL